jgi:glycopeptide antibiotics resistance protein
MFQCIKIDILQEMQYLPVSLSAGIIAYLCLFMAGLFERDCAMSIKDLLFHRKHIVFSLAVFYLTLIFYIVFWCREPGSRIQANLTIGGTWSGDPQGRAYVIENVLLFIPVGMLISAWFRHFRTLKAVLFGAALSALIETAQYITQRGFFQVDDLLTNIVGSLVGSLLFCLIHRVFKHVLSV